MSFSFFSILAEQQGRELVKGALQSGSVPYVGLTGRTFATEAKSTSSLCSPEFPFSLLHPLLLLSDPVVITFDRVFVSSAPFAANVG